MRMLVCEWTAYMQQDLEDCLHGFGIDTVEYGYRWIGNFEEDDYFVRNFRPILEREKDSVDAVISMNYMAPLAVLCFELQLPYIAWVYDCPFGLVHPEKTLGLKTNYVFMFDRAEAEKYIRHGFDTVYHLPLAVNVNRLDEIASSADRDWLADVTFVGNLYGNDFDPLRTCLPEYEGGYIDGLMRAQSVLYGAYILRDGISEKVTEEWKRYYTGSKEIEMLDPEHFQRWMESTIAKEITRRERRKILSVLSHHTHTCLYSPYPDDMLKDVDQRGVISAFDEAPKVYNRSKVNLNMTLKNLTSGIPLRALEIMGSGGFLLSNWQPEIAENFVDGEEVVMYDSIEDAIKKAMYYVSHDEERMRIAANGRRAAERFSFENQVGCILKTVFPEGMDGV